MREDLLKELETEYTSRRMANERTEALRKTLIRNRFPEIDRLVQQREDLFRNAARRALTHSENGNDLKKDAADLNAQIRQSLRDAGFPEDYLSPVFRCALCGDTGYVGEPVREPCRCLIDAYQDMLRERIGLEGGQNETFETFDLSMIPDDRVPGQAYSQRDLSRVARERCEKWADTYPENTRRTMVISGQSGLGKTFLMHAMAHRMIERGYQVLMISAFQFLQTARGSMFEYDSGMDELIAAPALMLDDLGSEPLMKNITIEYLFYLINERQTKGLSTVISTNLTMEEIRERYTERICSRISDPGNSTVIALEGMDLRRVRSERK